MWTRVGNESNSQRLGKFYFASRESALKILVQPKKVSPPATEDPRGKFYEHYLKVAEDYDREFLKKYDEDLNTTLIFVCCAHHSITPC